MRRLLLAGLLALLVAAPAGAAATAAAPPDAKALLRVASRLGGLSVRRAVPVVVDRPARFRLRRAAALDRLRPKAGRAHDEAVLRALGVTGRRGVVRKALAASDTRTALYDPRTRRVHLSARRPSQRVLLTELVHALQDQHFHVAARRRGLDRDASLAAAAALAGHASLVAGPVRPWRPARTGAARLDRFLELERGFVASVGRRLAVDLRNLGGNRAVLSALRRLPATTEQVFHLDKLLQREPASPVVLPRDAAGLRLVSDDTFGELDVRALLAVHRVPRLDRAASGWGGGRTGVYRSGGVEAVAVAVDWDTEADAREWEEAAGALAGAASGATAFARDGTRTVLAIAADAATAAGVAAAVVPPAADPPSLDLESSLSDSIEGAR